MINILILIHNLRPANGVASFAMNYFRKLDPNRVHMDFVLYADRPSPYYEEIKQAGSIIYILPNVKDIKSHLKKCNEVLTAKNYDVIHDNTLHISIPMMWCAKKKKIQVRILHSHNTKLGETHRKEIRNKLFLPLLCGLATNYVSCSELAGKATFVKKQFRVIPNVINTEKYHFSEGVRSYIRKETKTESKFIVGTVGRISEQKNPFFAMDVFAELLNVVPNTEYWWIGSGELDKQVTEYADSKGLSKSVRFLGNRTDVLDLYQGMDCFFLPSLFEGLPVTGVEAQAMGLPMVVSDTVTNEMVYTDLVDYVSLSESVEVWAKHLKKALNRKVNRESYSDRLKQSVFSDVGCGERLMNLYTEMLHNPGGM